MPPEAKRLAMAVQPSLISVYYSIKIQDLPFLHLSEEAQLMNETYAGHDNLQRPHQGLTCGNQPSYSLSPNCRPDPLQRSNAERRLFSLVGSRQMGAFQTIFWLRIFKIFFFNAIEIIHFWP